MVEVVVTNVVVVVVVVLVVVMMLVVVVVVPSSLLMIVARALIGSPRVQSGSAASVRIAVSLPSITASLIGLRVTLALVAPAGKERMLEESA